MSPSAILSTPDIHAIVADIDVVVGERAAATDVGFLRQPLPHACAACSGAIQETRDEYVQTANDFEIHLQIARRAHSSLWLIRTGSNTDMRPVWHRYELQFFKPRETD